ncbi:MAG TPA: GNAT family N-acetyltransferase [Thermoleophilaceae bacterium]
MSATVAPVQVRPVARTVDPLAQGDWLALVERAPDASIFHHPAWLSLLHGAYGYAIEACCVAAQDGRLLGGLPVAEVSSRLTGRRLVALPFSDLCAPLIAPDAPPGAEVALHDALARLRRDRGVPLEVRGDGRALRGAAPGERFHHHVIALEDDVAAVARRFTKPQVSRGVRRAVREGLQTSRCVDRSALLAFYRLHAATRRRLGVPTQPRRFILGFEALFQQGLGFVLLVHREGQPIAAGVFLTFGDTLLYKYGASDARWLQMRPNNLLFMEAIRWGCEHGMRALDLGRTHWGQESLRAFKLGWGAQERELRYRYVGGGAPIARGASGHRVLAAVIRRSPPLAGRVIGEVLYRHVG